jgi:hypothetical protein
MTRKITGGAVALALTLVAAAPAAAQAPLRFSESELFIEINATDGDAGLQMQLGGEEWERLRLIDPRDRTIMDVRAGGSLDGYGLTDMFFESNEPPFRRVPFRRFRDRFPEGRYRFEGTAVNGRRLTGSDRLTHVVPAAPRVLAPVRNAVVDPASLVVRWEPVTGPQGIRIVRYQVIVSGAGPFGDFQVDLPPSATSATVPPGVLARGARYAVEVIARAASGNQTITEVRFRTAP